MGETFDLLFSVEPDLESGLFVATWDDPAGGGITTQGRNLADLTAAIKEAVECHFGNDVAPRTASLHFTDAELQLA